MYNYHCAFLPASKIMSSFVGSKVFFLQELNTVLRGHLILSSVTRSLWACFKIRLRLHLAGFWVHRISIIEIFSFFIGTTFTNFDETKGHLRMPVEVSGCGQYV